MSHLNLQTSGLTAFFAYVVFQSYRISSTYIRWLSVYTCNGGMP